jgi:hypothetical protein
VLPVFAKQNKQQGMNKNHALNEITRANNGIYKPNKLHLDNLQSEDAHADYGAMTFTLNQHPVKFRIAKVTPVKIGCFVAIWKKNSSDKNIPHDIEDPFAIYIFHVENKGRRGQFIFPKHILRQNNIISEKGKGGKLGFRLYPAWDNAENKQAKKTQAWQLPYFFEIKEQSSLVLPAELLAAI